MRQEEATVDGFSHERAKMFFNEKMDGLVLKLEESSTEDLTPCSQCFGK